MSELQLWHGRSLIQLKNIKINETLDIVKVCCIEKLVFLLATDGTIYRGHLNEDSCLTCDKIDLKAVDFGCTLQKIYIVNSQGRTLSCTPEQLLSITSESELQIDGEGIQCVTQDNLNVKTLCIGGRGIVYIDDIGQFWASGWQKELGIDDPHIDSEPKLIEAFIGRHVLDVSLGADFGLVLLQPNDNSDDRRSPSPKNIQEKTNNSGSQLQTVFANVDAAKVYIKRQLSWVSGDVVGFVKNVGERQRRDSSESFEELDVIDDERTRILLEDNGRDSSLRQSEEVELQTPNKSEESSLSTSSEFGSTLKVPGNLGDSCVTLSGSSHGSESERALALSRAGLALLDTEVWSWGDARGGQLGLGDMAKRCKPSLINRLKNCGVRQIACGAHHALALLLDGRVFIWGERQSSAGTTCSLETLPRCLNLPDKARAVGISAHNDLSYVLTSHGRVFMLSKHSCYPEGIVELSWPKAQENQKLSAHRLLCSSQLCACVSSNKLKLPESRIARLIKEQQLLEDMLEVKRLLMLKLQEPTPEVQVLLRCHRAVMGVTALNVAALADAEHGQASLLKHHTELLTVYQQFLTALSDCIASGTLHEAVAFESKSGKQIGVVAALCRPLDNISIYNEEAKIDGGETSEQAKAWRKLKSEARFQLNSAEETRLFWDTLANRFSLKSQLQEKSHHRRLVRDSRDHPIELVGASRFSGPHWFILMSDCLAHVCGSQVDIHQLQTLWVEPIPDTQNLQNALLLIAPEANLTVKCPSPNERAEWLQTSQTAIKNFLRKPHLLAPPSARNVSHTFIKHILYKGATYTGRWVQGLPEGPGRMEWPEGRVYTGGFHNGHLHGKGRQTYPDGSYYEGQWADGFQNGYGIERSARGDVYEGHFLHGQRHGHGVRKEGQFMSSAASVYVGEWVVGRRQGYGVSDEISTGEKYLGLWSNDAKHGCGMVVTLDGIYYEGNFANGNLTGRGVMVWEDGSCYEGEFGAAGVFAGKGKLSLTSGDQFEGTLHGAWNEGVKVNGIFKKSVTSGGPSDSQPPKPSLFGKLSVLAGEKWRSVFRECVSQLGVPNGEENWEAGGVRTVKAWESVAVALNQNQARVTLSLDTIPQYGRVTLDAHSYQQIKLYLAKAFEEKQHPLGLLLSQLTAAYTATYGGVRVHPVLLGPAVSELHSLCSRLYNIVRLLFPALPAPGEEQLLNSAPRLATTSMPNIEQHQREPQIRPRSLSAVEEQELGGMGDNALPLQDMKKEKVVTPQDVKKDVSPSHEEDTSHPSIVLNSRRSSTLSNISDAEVDDREVASSANLLYPLLLPRVHSALFVLYALHNKTQDDEYWRKLLKWNKQFDIALMAFLGIDRKFWPGPSESNSRGGHMFSEAVDTLQQLKTTFSPLEKLLVIRSTFQHLTKAVQHKLDCEYLWTMDELFPVFQLVVIRAQILQLGSEIHFVEDFMEPHLLNGELGIMFTTVKACYYQILQERIN